MINPVYLVRSAPLFFYLPFPVTGLTPADPNEY